MWSDAARVALALVLLGIGASAGAFQGADVVDVLNRPRNGLVKPPVQQPVQRPVQLRDPLAVQQVTPAPEVVRLWSEEVLRATKVQPKVRDAVAELDSTDFARRVAATRTLEDASIAPEQIFAVLDRERLTAEQRERLLSAVRAKVLALPRGALGIRMQPSGDPKRPGVEVIMLLPGMPAGAVLKVGDRIEQIDGKPIANSNDLVDIIQSRLPGESVRLHVARPERDDRGKPRLDGQGGFVEQVIEVEVRLTTASDLDRFEGQFPTMTRSLVLDRRLLALQLAEARFSPAPVPVRTRGAADADPDLGEPDPAPDAQGP